ncbi:hypothetical protein GRI43_08615 [Altererythrobacter luteolus]|uniref:DUF7662 domain-containing protein n=1 Tax=Pontixanthobacter luteolus TaxID=295089 RepID=A0A6I4V693_9SPHN|nr:GIY-YIG nuclease family protein [Pontixanthobacter luteolus]MXP47442.1 hypothetical protein [Pontixanthobacter luteolus]
MKSEKPTLRTDDLLKRGFIHACEWRIIENRLKQSARLPDHPGVYAFCIDGVAQYIGLASKSLARRIYGYEKPGSTQRTNQRLNELLLAQAKSGISVQIVVASPPDFEWNGWSISGAEGLEAALIRDYSLPWNVRGSTAKVSAPRRNTPSPKRPTEGFNTNRHPGKYGPLRSFLEDCRQDRISMTFRQIEDLVGKLPKSASLYQAWWGNHEGNSQAKAWMGARYLVEANPAGRSVIFRKFEY